MAVLLVLAGVFLVAVLVEDLQVLSHFLQTHLEQPHLLAPLLQVGLCVAPEEVAAPTPLSVHRLLYYYAPPLALHLPSLLQLTLTLTAQTYQGVVGGEGRELGSVRSDVADARSYNLSILSHWDREVILDFLADPLLNFLEDLHFLLGLEPLCLFV